jgi:hypothetical protein
MKFNIKVAYRTPAGAVVEETVVTTLADTAHWERKKKKTVRDMMNGIGIDDLAFMAWHRLVAMAKENRDYDTWLECVTDLDVIEEQSTNPTEAAASAGN